MSTVSPQQVSDGTTADASDVNTPINQIAAVINGNIDNSNIPTGAAIDGAKLANNSVDIGAKASVFDGWIAVSDTWTYASATTVTVPSDATTKYSVGDKVKFTNSGAKFFYITAVSATTLTLNGGSDYTVANAAITVPYYSKAETPLGFPGFFNFTPTWANFTPGSATQVARFSMHGKWVDVALKVILSGSTISGVPVITLPVGEDTTVYPSATGNNIIGTGNLEDAATFGYIGMASINATPGAGKALFLTQTASGTYTVLSALSSTVPFTWGNGDSISINLHYKAA